jgi:hypothetical protein
MTYKKSIDWLADLTKPAENKASNFNVHIETPLRAKRKGKHGVTLYLDKAIYDEITASSTGTTALAIDALLLFALESLRDKTLIYDGIAAKIKD